MTNRADRANFTGQTVVITGNPQGLGTGIARRFAQAGAAVVFADHNPDAGERAAAALAQEGLNAGFASLDVRDASQVNAFVQKLVADRGRIDVWINNAAIICEGAAETLPPDSWRDSIDFILSGAFYCAQAAGGQMISQGKGVIVNIAAVDGHQSIEGRVAYSAANGGLMTLTQALGIEWARRGVRVVGIAPGLVPGDPVRGVLDVRASAAVYERRTPMHRLPAITELAEAVLYLASDEASYIVGETMRVDGGWLAYQLF
jgi:3-oxoacyl-[acyl-carrier protein] reductase